MTKSEGLVLRFSEFKHYLCFVIRASAFFCNSSLGGSSLSSFPRELRQRRQRLRRDMFIVSCANPNQQAPLGASCERYVKWSTPIPKYISTWSSQFPAAPAQLPRPTAKSFRN